MPTNTTSQTQKRQSVPMAVGPMWTRGDAVKSDPVSTTKARNCAMVRGVVEKRFPFTMDGTFDMNSGATLIKGSLWRYRTSSSDQMIAGGDDYGSSSVSFAAYRASAGVYTPFTNTYAISDAVSFQDVMYMLTSSTTYAASDGTNCTSWNGTTEAQYPLSTRIGGSTIASFIGRLFIGGAKLRLDSPGNGGNSSYDFSTGATWTVGGAWSQPTVSSGYRITTIANATTDTIKTTAAFFTNGATEQYVTLVFWLAPISATVSTPIKIKLEDSAGTTIYGQAEYNIPNATDDGQWRQYWVTARVPPSAATFARLDIGNSSGGGTVGVAFRIGYFDGANSGYGAMVYPGHFLHPYAINTLTPAAGNYYSKTGRVYWSEPLDPSDWRATNYADCVDSPGDITAIRPCSGRLVVYKKNAMWTFRPGNTADTAVVREGYIPAIGTYSPRSITTFEDIHFFIGPSEVYAFDGSSSPIPLCGEGMRDEMFDVTNFAPVPIIAVDEAKRTLWAYVQKYKIYIYSLDDKKWVGYYQLTDVEGTESPYSPSGAIVDMEYLTNEMWVLWDKSGSTVTGTDLRYSAYLDSSATRDTCDGTARDVVAEYVFHALESARPRSQITVQTVGLDHKVTASQTGSTTRYAVSLDNGNTWSKYNDVTLTPLSAGASSDTQIMRVPVHQTAPRMLLKIQHTGLAGPTYFNTTGGQADVIIRGREVQSTNPTAVTSSL